MIEGIEPRYASKDHLSKPYFSRAAVINAEITKIQERLKEIVKLKTML